jgi:hypothetical protein
MTARMEKAPLIRENELVRELTEEELRQTTGGMFSALSSAISEVMKNFGGALSTAARGG